MELQDEVEAPNEKNYNGIRWLTVVRDKIRLFERILYG